MNKVRYAYIHEVCGKAAFYFPEKPIFEAGKPKVVSSEGVTWPDGTPVEPFSEMRCGSCGELMNKRPHPDNIKEEMTQ